MEISYRIPGLSKVRAAVKLTEGQIASRDALSIDTSLDLIKNALLPQIATGPGHFGFHARDKLFTRVAAGKRVAGILYTTAPQLRWSETGTRPHMIKEWVDTGRGYSFQVVIHHPGEKATHLFKRTLAAMKPAIRGVFVGATQRLISELANAAKTA